MEREFQCPACGAANLVTNPGILMKVCDYCKSAIYWDKESALRAGRKSMDLPPSSRFRVGSSGKVTGRSFTVLGRLAYAYENGTWSEWFVEMEDGEIKWLSEDEGELFLESPVKLTSPVPSYEKLRPGTHIFLNDRSGVVEELGSARCLGGEGQIPFVVEIGEVYRYADGSGLDGSFSFGLEYDAATGQPTAFVGTILSVKDSRSRREDRAAPVGKTSEVIRCASCGKPYEGPRVKTTEMVVCEACGAGLVLDEAETRVVGQNEGKQPKFTFQAGAPITLEGIGYEVMGRLLYEEVDEEGVYKSAEYILYHPDAGYLWLSEEDGHFTISRPIHVSFAPPPIPIAKMKVKVGQEVFQFFEGGSTKLRWVDGALPWTAVVGEETRYKHVIKPPEYADQEITGAEVELFRGRYVSHEEMAKAVPKGIRLPASRGVYSCQPYVRPSWLRGLSPIAAAFVVLNLFLFFYSLVMNRATTVLSESITADQYTNEHLTKPFIVDKDKTILKLKGSAQLNDSWLALDFAVVNASRDVVSDFYNEASYYHGVDSEGPWTEGSRTFSDYFMIRKAGTYQLLVHATGGSGTGGPALNEPITMEVTAGHTISWYFWIPILLSGIVAALGPAHKLVFEWMRWSPVVGGTGDDDD
jgi:hypothetical protein